jgi:hypothetical protein
MAKPSNIAVLAALAEELDTPEARKLLKACRAKGRADKSDLKKIIAVAEKNPHCYNNPRRNRGPVKRKFKKLTKAERARLPASEFVFPRARLFPINDYGHARTALTFVMTPSNAKYRKKVKSAVFKRYPSLKRWWNSTDWVKRHRSERVK